MEALNYSYVRQNLAGVMDECCNDHEPIIVTRKNRVNQVVIIGKEDYDSWMETLHILQTHDLEKLAKSIAQADSGSACQRELLDG